MCFKVKIAISRENILKFSFSHDLLRCIEEGGGLRKSQYSHGKLQLRRGRALRPPSRKFDLGDRREPKI